MLDELIIKGGNTEEIINRLGLVQNSDTGFLSELAGNVIALNEKSVNDYRNGKTNALGYLVGQAMKASGGKADPAKLRGILENKLKTEE